MRVVLGSCESNSDRIRKETVIKMEAGTERRGILYGTLTLALKLDTGIEREVGPVIMEDMEIEG